MGYPDGHVFSMNFLSRLLNNSHAAIKAMIAPMMHVPIAIPTTAPLLTPPLLLLPLADCACGASVIVACGVALVEAARTVVRTASGVSVTMSTDIFVYEEPSSLVNTDVQADDTTVALAIVSVASPVASISSLVKPSDVAATAVAAAPDGFAHSGAWALKAQFTPWGLLRTRSAITT